MVVWSGVRTTKDVIQSTPAMVVRAEVLTARGKRKLYQPKYRESPWPQYPQSQRDCEN